MQNSIKKILFKKSSKYNKELNFLPNFVEQIQLPMYYNKQIKKFPIKLEKIICYCNYKYKEDFKIFLIETYE